MSLTNSPSPFADPLDGVAGSASEVLLRPDDLVGAIGRFLRNVWAAPLPQGRAVEISTSSCLAQVTERVRLGLVDPDTFDEPYRGQSPERLCAIAADLASMLSQLPANSTEDGAVQRWVHGGLAVPDLRLGDGEVIGWPVVDTPWVGDRYLDLACLARSMATVIGPAAAPALFDAAGVERPNPVRLEFWVIVSQLL